MEVTPGLVTAKALNQSSGPEGWRHIRLTEVARLESGHTPSKRQPDYWGGSIPWVSLHDTEGLDAWEIQTTSQSITDAGLANSSARLLPKGTVVFSRTATVGKSTVMGRAMATSQDFACYVCGPEVHNFYLALLLRSMRAEWKKLMAGSIHNTVYMPVFKTLSVDLPPHGEQVAIANAMRDVERMVDSLEQLLTKKRQIKQGAMQELLTGKRRLPGFTGEWADRSLLELADIRSGGTPSTRQPEFWDGAIPWCTPTDITSLAGAKYIAVTERSISEKGQNASAAETLPVGTVVMTSRATIGECAIASVPITTNQGFKNFVPHSKTCGEFLYYLLGTQRSAFLALCSGSTFLEIGKRQLADFVVRCPLELEEQKAIAEVLSDIDAEITALETRLTKARALKQAMAQALLTGRIRLPVDTTESTP